MRKFWRVLSHEYLSHVKRKRFIFALLSVPLFMLFIVAVGFLTAILTTNNDPIGYVDPSGVLKGAVSQPDRAGPFADPSVLPFTSEQAGLNALQGEEIQSLFILAPDFLQSGDVRVVSDQDSNNEAQSEFRSFIRAQLTTALPENIAERGD